MLFEVVSSMVDAWIVLVTSAQSLYGSPGSSTVETIGRKRRNNDEDRYDESG